MEQIAMAAMKFENFKACLARAPRRLAERRDHCAIALSIARGIGEPADN